ncbi:MAG: nucleotidyl transferase AbiEii/AbiGii toxin family protein [Planctomycetes bacterium]|nr:nucleotidyl transferase AbiEii/AbiGii toxin family protein [Planctomycetota bacterium]
MDDLLRRVHGDLGSLRLGFALVGGHAVSVRTTPRFTCDLDFAIAVHDDREAESVVASLAARGYRIVALVEQATTKRLATVRLEHASAPGVMVDLLFATSGIEPELVAAAGDVTIVPGLTMPVASIGHLLAMKVLSMDDRHRPQDRQDLAALLAKAAPADVAVAESALALISRRGCDRGRDLAGSFARLRAGMA